MKALVSCDRNAPWLENVASNGDTVPIKYVSSINPESLGESTDEDRGILYIDIGNVDSNGNITALQAMKFGNAPSRARRVVRRGDVVVSTVRTYLRAIAAVEEEDPRLIASTGFAVVRPNPRRVHPGFMRHWLRSDPVVDEVCARSVGISYPATNASEVGSIPVVLPPLPTQRAIADFLDRKTAAIDALIEKKERLLELLAEKRAALIHRAVTKGLDPSVPMKDSGVPWIGEIPEHWDARRFKFLTTESIAGPYGSSLTKAMYTTEGYRVYGQQQVIPDDFKVGDYYISPEKFETMRRYEVRPDDLLISVMGTVGKAAVVPPDVEPGIINPRLVMYRIDQSQVSVRFLQLFILSDAGQAPLLEAAQGSTMDGLNMGIIGELRVAIPPRDEQDEVNRAARKAASMVEDVAAKIRNQLAAMKEYRQALITAAVTGQLDITAAEDQPLLAAEPSLHASPEAR